MAMIDYGAIAFKNGKLISTDMFTPMKDTCGFSDEDNILPEMQQSFDGNYFVVIGNYNILIGFYKTAIHWWLEDDIPDDDFNVGLREHESDGELFGCSDFEKWRRWRKNFYFHSFENVEIIVKPKNGYYVARFTLDGDHYKVYFGYGVDLEFYKRTHRVNYYRSPEHFLKRNVVFKIEGIIHVMRIRRLVKNDRIRFHHRISRKRREEKRREENGSTLRNKLLRFLKYNYNGAEGQYGINKEGKA